MHAWIVCMRVRNNVYVCVRAYIHCIICMYTCVVLVVNTEKKNENPEFARGFYDKDIDY